MERNPLYNAFPNTSDSSQSGQGVVQQVKPVAVYEQIDDLQAQHSSDREKRDSPFVS